MDNQTLDPQVVNLAKSIRQSETGGDFSKTGKSGEYGGYQFTQPTWDSYSKQYGINTPLHTATPEQQNAVAYNKIKEWKDSGKDVTQIASMWNAGEGEPNAYTGKFSDGSPSKGVNKSGVKYNVPAYAESVARGYQTLKGGGSVSADPNNPSSTSNPDNAPQLKPQGENYGASFPASQDDNLLTGGLKAIGNIPSSAVNLAGNLGNAILHPISTIKNVGDVISGGVEKGLDTLGATTNVDTAEKQKFDAMVGGLKDRYGSLDNLRKTLTNDPTGSALDIATILEGGGAGLRIAGKAGEISELSKAGEIAGNVGRAVNPIEIVGRGISKSFNWTGNKLIGKQNQLEVENLRMTPVQQVKYGAKVPDVLQWAKDNGLNVGNPAERYAKSIQLVNNYETKLQDFLNTNNTAKGIFVNKGDIIDELSKLKDTLSKDSSDAPLIQKQIQMAIDNVGQQYVGQKIPISRLNELKRSTFSNAYNVGGDKVLNWVEHDVGSVYKNAIEDATNGLTLDGKSIKDFNKEYGIALTTKKLLRTASTRPEIDFLGRGTGRLASTFLADKLGGIPGAIIAYFAEPAIAKWLGGTAARSVRGKVLSGVGGGLLKIGGGINKATPFAGNTGLMGNLINKATGVSGK